jgi:hypothetical protein
MNMPRLLSWYFTGEQNPTKQEKLFSKVAAAAAPCGCQMALSSTTVTAWSVLAAALQATLGPMAENHMAAPP